MIIIYKCSFLFVKPKNFIYSYHPGRSTLFSYERYYVVNTFEYLFALFALICNESVPVINIPIVWVTLPFTPIYQLSFSAILMTY